MSGLQKREGLEGSDPIHKHLPSTHDNFFIEEKYTKAPDCNTGQFVMPVKQIDAWPPRVSLKNEKERARVWHRGCSDRFLPSTHWGAPRRHWQHKVSDHAGVTQAWAVRYHKSDLISLELIALCLAPILALPLPKFPSFPIKETAWLPGEKYFTHCRQHSGSRRNLSWQCSQAITALNQSQVLFHVKVTHTYCQLLSLPILLSISQQCLAHPHHLQAGFCHRSACAGKQIPINPRYSFPPLPSVSLLLFLLLSSLPHLSIPPNIPHQHCRTDET